MPIRFSTQAANADNIEPDGGDVAGRVPANRGAAPREVDSQAAGERGEGQPGKDINAAGFIKDKDTSKP